MRFCRLTLGIFIVIAVVLPLWGEDAPDSLANSDADQLSYVGERHTMLNEFGAGIAGCLAPMLILPPLTLYPIGYVIMPLDGKPFQYVADPLETVDPFWGAYLATPLGSALAVSLYGRQMKHNGSIPGAFLGAAAGEAAWLGTYWTTRKLLPESVVASNLVYFSGPLWISVGSFGGYNLLAHRSKKESPSLGFNIAPILDANGAGVEVSLRF